MPSSGPSRLYPLLGAILLLKQIEDGTRVDISLPEEQGHKVVSLKVYLSGILG